MNSVNINELEHVTVNDITITRYIKTKENLNGVFNILDEESPNRELHCYYKDGKWHRDNDEPAVSFIYSDHVTNLYYKDGVVYTPEKN